MPRTYRSNTWLLATLIALSPALAPLPASAQTTAEINADGKNTDNVLTQSMGLARQSYSPLAEINKTNIKRLVPVWSTSLMNDLGELAAPVVYDGVIYVINAKWTFAIDAATGRQIWRTPVQIEPGFTRAATAIYRGAPAIYDGKLFRVTVDNHLVALEMKTGRVLWNKKFAEWKEGYHSSGAPIVANGVLISGVAGGESTTRGFLDGWDPQTGEKLWRRYTIPAPGEPGSETWPADSDAWKYGGGSLWRSGSYDPELDLVYWGVGNAEPYDPRPREALDSLYTDSVLAIRPKTGEIVCYYQYTPNDIYDVDATDEQVLADLPIDGQMRKVMIQSNKNGFMYVVDRTNCKLIAAHPYTQVNWASGIDMATGRPQLTRIYKDFLAGGEVEILPSRGSNAVPIAYDPSKKLVYAAPWDEPRIQQLAPPHPQVIGENSTGVNGRQPHIEPGQVVGYFIAMDPLTGLRKWEVPLADVPSSAGMLATGGGLVFTGKLTGEFLALDADTGKQLWQFQTSSAINSTAITYTHNGRQYVTVASGLGGILARRAIGDKVPTGDSLWTFALMPE
ncbi:MAG TPA: PQQ-dependent dehydrogenase, methanol/ethanol family [Xanthobacteraceae bacterium]|nr:PQQ-dependent dehydrogenase, methanol/ethanol family [Xanthobacteraceae bacterium]